MLRTSDVLISQTLTLLYYCIESSSNSNVTKNTANSIIEEINFSSNDILENVRIPIFGEKSIIQLIFELLQRKEFKEQFEVMHGILKSLEKDNFCKEIIENNNKKEVFFGS